MNINATLLGEMITFAVLVWVTMKFIWPPIVKAMEERQKKIADGLKAAERSQNRLELAEKKVKEQLKTAKLEAANIVDQANKRVAQIIEEAKETAGTEGQKILSLAKIEIATEMEAVKQKLRKQIALIVIEASEKVLQRSIDAAANQELIDKFIKEI